MGRGACVFGSGIGFIGKRCEPGQTGSLLSCLLVLDYEPIDVITRKAIS